MSLQQAIQNSTIFIPIFSPDYASSAWCLREISLMWKLKSTHPHTILMIPLFYNVNPSDVRYPNYRGRPYAEAFQKHWTQGRHSPGQIVGWRDALSQVSCLSGWSLKETSFGFEGKLVKRVVKDVLQTLNIGVLDVAKRPVGLIPRSEEVIQLLKLGDKTGDRLTLGIWGMGGLGKTTLSKALYNKIHHLFEASSFVSVAKLDEPSQGLRKLQQQILKDLLKTQIKLNDIDHGKILMRNHLASLRVLVVLDDVDNVRQLDALMGDWFGEGSRIIITTWDKRVLEVRQVDVIYPMRGLDLAEGVELFSWHAFLRARPERGYEDMTERIAKACWGLPLSLEIIGTDLYDRNNIIYWTDALHKLENVDHGFVLKILKISYDNLTPVEKHIFLDIACFFLELKSSVFIQNRAFTMDFYARFWSALGWEPVFTSLKTLEDKALIVIHEHRYIEAIDEDVDEEDHTAQYFCEFSMHDQIRDMGRRIVREESWNDPTKRSRVWREEDIRTLMADTTLQENKNVEGLMWRKHMELQHIDTFASLWKLDFLLCCKLQVKTEIRGLPTNLKYLVLSKCQLKENNPKMAGIESSSDHNGSSVLSSVLPKSIAQLIFLRYLDMSGTKQTCLPNEVCELNCLEELYLNRCSLEALPEAFGNLTKLQTLDVSNNFLSEFPPSFQHLKSLVNLEIAWNEKFVVFPALPEGLIALNARRCSKLQAISLKSEMNFLKTMDLSHCKSLTQFPTLVSWKSLRDLRLDGCKQLDKLDLLPEWVTSLRISGCSQLKKISFSPPPPPPPRGDVPHRYSCQLRKVRKAVSPRKMQRLCMIGCDSIRLNIFQLLRDLPYLEQLDLSLSPEEELLSESQPLVGQKNLTLQRDILIVPILFCFILESNGNVRLPQMDVFATFLTEGGDCSFSQTFKLPSCMKGDDSGRFIMRICIWNATVLSQLGTTSWPFSKSGTMRCSYSIQDQLSQHGSQVSLRQVEILLLERHGTSQITTQFLQQWKCLSSSNVFRGEENEEDGEEEIEKERQEKKRKLKKITQY